MTKTAVSNAMPNTMLTVNGRRTSVRLEPVFIAALHDIAEEQGISVHELASRIERDHDPECGPLNLTSAIRVYVASVYREAALRARSSRAAPRRNLGETGHAWAA